jgi:hypothetical protein
MLALQEGWRELKASAPNPTHTLPQREPHLHAHQLKCTSDESIDASPAKATSGSQPHQHLPHSQPQVLLP